MDTSFARAIPPSRVEEMDYSMLRSASNESSVELRFEDFLDVINPLQHIPFVSSIYRAVTGDEISGPARVIGGALFGGPLGFVGGIIDAIAAETSGGGLGELAIAALFGEEDTRIAVAQNAQDPDIRDSAGALETPPLVLAAVQDDGGAALTGAALTGGATLTGAAALQALTADLRGAGAVIAAGTASVDPSTALRGGVDGFRDRPLAVPPLDGFTLQMLDGLDKYKVLAVGQQRRGDTL